MQAVAGKFGSIVGVTAALLFLGAGVASAHVTVAAPGVTAGASDAAITLRVPDESATASTVGLKVQLPIDHPIVGVLVAPVTGWTAKITNTKLAKPITMVRRPPSVPSFGVCSAPTTKALLPRRRPEG